MNNVNDNYNVTFEIKVYENDWRYLLIGDYLDKIISRCNYKFKKKILLINNVDNIKEVIYYADIKIVNKVIDSYYIVEDFAFEVLNYFKIKKESFKRGYYYSISELVGIYLCDTNYLLHLSSDSFIEQSNVNWIRKAIDIFKINKDIIVANPTWNFNYEEAKKETISEIGDFYFGYGFSDQCYLIRLNIFKNQIYNEIHPDSSRYPKYGGELFEKRVDSYMRNNEKYRITSKEVSYIHENFPKNFINIFNKKNNDLMLNGRLNYTKTKLH